MTKRQRAKSFVVKFYLSFTMWLNPNNNIRFIDVVQFTFKKGDVKLR